MKAGVGRWQEAASAFDVQYVGLVCKLGHNIDLGLKRWKGWCWGGQAFEHGDWQPPGSCIAPDACCTAVVMDHHVLTNQLEAQFPTQQPWPTAGGHQPS